MAEIQVFYNGGCPICSREIGHYRRLADQAGVGIGWVDIEQQPAALRPHGLGGEDLRRRLYAIDGEGRLLDGVPAFALIWRALPRYRWLGALANAPLSGPLMRWAYDPVARWLYRRDRRRRAEEAQERASAAPRAEP